MNPSTAAPPDIEGLARYDLKYLWSICLVAAMGGLLFGYDWVVIGGAKPFFESHFNLTNAQLSGWANSCALLGCLFGAMTSGWLSDKFGRKKLLILAAFIFAVSSILTGWAATFHQFVIWRILGGTAIGMASNLSPMYIAEVAPAHLRGRLVAINQLTIVIGILIAQVVNYLIGRGAPTPTAEAVAHLKQTLAVTEDVAKSMASIELLRDTWYGQYGWRWMFTAVTGPSLVFFFSALFVPESPRWLVKNGRDALAQRILARISGEEHAIAQVGGIRQTLSAEEVQHVRLSDLLEPRMMKILAIGVILAVLQQWCGINVIFNYAQEIFRTAGYSVSDTLFNIVITGAVMLLFTLIAIQTVDHFGRRKLMLIGCAGIGIFHTLIGMCYAAHYQGLPVLVSVLATIACYSFSLAPITWVLISEIFPNRIRGTAVSVAVSALWIACFILTYTFPLLNGKLGPAKTFWVYAAICFAGFFFILARVPETRGKTLEQIEQELVG